MALGRALARHGERRGAAGAGLHAHQAAAPNPELHEFMARFKEMAATMDEQGAQNLLRWSPLFMPTINSLIQPASADAALGLDASATVPVGHVGVEAQILCSQLGPDCLPYGAARRGDWRRPGRRSSESDPGRRTTMRTSGPRSTARGSDRARMRIASVQTTLQLHTTSYKYNLYKYKL